jgi:hypothetical protein
VVGALAVLRLHGDDRPERPSGIAALVLLPFAVMTGVAFAWVLLPRPVRLEWFLGGDHVRHVIFARSVVVVWLAASGPWSHLPTTAAPSPRATAPRWTTGR